MPALGTHRRAHGTCCRRGEAKLLPSHTSTKQSQGLIFSHLELALALHETPAGVGGGHAGPALGASWRGSARASRDPKRGPGKPAPPPRRWRAPGSDLGKLAPGSLTSSFARLKRSP